MIRTKAKSLFLGIALILACFCLFACKETKVKVDDVKFEEYSISMLVGEEYSPHIKILPSYATDRSYKLISGDTTVLSVEGGTIKALKETDGVSLKVVSNENSNCNDVITVKIYAEPVVLSAPSGLVFDGEGISFVDFNDSSVSSYMLKIGTREINIGNNTEYSFDSLVEKFGIGLYNAEVTCRVKAVGDQKIFKDSEYSDPVTFTKLSSVKNATIKDSKLYFTPVGNVVDYKVEVFKDGKTFTTITETNYKLSNGIDLSELNDFENGAEYVLNIVPTITENMFNSEVATVKYVVVGQVANLTIKDIAVSWDFVKNAQSYDVEVYKGATKIKEYKDVIYNNIHLPVEIRNSAGDYTCKVISKSSAANTTQGNIAKSIEFSVLPAPVVSAEGNAVSWTSVENVEGYLVAIFKQGVEIAKKLVAQTSYDVSSFAAGDYTISVVACGNGGNIISSAASATKSWKILSNANISISNKTIVWDDVGAVSYDLVCVSNDDGGEIINTTVTDCQYSLPAQIDAGTYTIYVHPKGEGSTFDAKVTNTSMTKLENAQISGLIDKKFNIVKAAGGVRYELHIDKVGDDQFDTIVLNNLSGNVFALNASELSAGDYLANIYVYGNNANILDADNDKSNFQFSKLATPQMEVGDQGIKVFPVKDADEYGLYKNGSTKSENMEYRAGNSSIAEHYYHSFDWNINVETYKAQAIGDGMTVLDSELTSEADLVRVRKLNSPSITFDKTALTYTLTSTEDELKYISSYMCGISSYKYISVDKGNSTIQMSQIVDEIEVGKEYNFIAWPKVVDKAEYEDEYAIIVVSQSSVYNGVTKMSGECSFELDGAGRLVVSPTAELGGDGYGLSLRIENGDNDIELNQFTYSAADKKFVSSKPLYDNDYNILAELSAITQGAGVYTIFATISSSNPNAITSDEYTITQRLSVVDKVEDIVRNGQTIEFDAISGATNYIAVVSVMGDEKYIDLAGKYEAKSGDATKNVLTTTLEELLSEQSQYIANEEYEISFVAVSDDSHTLSNKGDAVYSFKFLSAPAVDVVELDGQGNSKYLSVAKNANCSKFSVVISSETTPDKEFVCDLGDAETYDAQDENCIYIDLGAVLQNFVSGELSISVRAKSNEGIYYDSKISTTSANKLSSAEISVENGKLTWAADANAKQYNLIYGNNVKSLTNGVAGFSVVDGICTYDFTSLAEGYTDFYLQIDADVNKGHYLNSNKTTTAKTIYKLPAVGINIVNGQLYAELKLSDVLKVAEATIYVDGAKSNIDISKTEDEQDGVTFDINVLADKVGITMSPTVLLKYNNMDAEEISIKLYSGDDSTLNSSTATKTVKGLISPSGLNITTATSTITSGATSEVVEKITWTNPSANGASVYNYEIIINYNEQDYMYYNTTTEFIMPKYYDANANNVKDSGEVEFGAGEYKIKVRALAPVKDNIENVVNSRYCDEISITVLSTPTKLKTVDGNIAWTGSSSDGYYLVRVYQLGENNTQTLIDSVTAEENAVDLSTLSAWGEGVYGITVQAMHDDLKILSSDESDVLQVVRLPNVAEYHINDGALEVKAHQFYSKMEIYLIDDGSSVVGPYTIINGSNASSQFVGGKTWLETSIVSTFKNEAYYASVKYGQDDTNTLLAALAKGYRLQVKLYGNSTIAGAIISGTTSMPHNSNLTVYDKETEKYIYTNELVKLVTPSVLVSDTTVGQVELSIPEGMTYKPIYFQNATGDALKGVHLYEINITTNAEHVFYVADIVNSGEFNAELKTLEYTVGNNTKELKYFVYDNKVFNVIEKTYRSDKGYITFNLNDSAYYYCSIDGGNVVASSVNLADGGSFVVNARFVGDDSKYAQSDLSASAIVKRYKSLALTVADGAITWENLATEHEKPIYLVTINNSSTGENYNIVLYSEIVNGAEEDIKSCLPQNVDYIFAPINYNLADKTIVCGVIADIVEQERALSGKAAINGSNGAFSATIRAYPIDDSKKDVILAQSANTVNFTILPKAQIGLSNGVLSWKLATVTTANSTTSVYKYMLQVLDASGRALAQTELNVSNMHKNGYAYFDLPITRSIDGYTLSTDTNYIFKLYTIASTGETYLNSISTTTSSVKIHPDLTGVTIENEVLKWNEKVDVDVIIRYVNSDGVEKVSQPITVLNVNSYALPTGFTDVNGTDCSIVPGYTYYLKVRRRGGSSILSGFYSDEVSTARLATIAANSIVSNAGVLTWPSATVDNSAVSGSAYTLEYTYGGTTSTISGHTHTNYDFAGVCAEGGEIKIKISAQHSKYLSSKPSSEVTINKLSKPTGVVAVDGTNVITWKEVEGADKYMVLVNSKTYTCLTNEWTVVSGTATSFSFQVKAMSSVAGGSLINGEYCNSVAFTMPTAVSSVSFNNSSRTFTWATTGEENVRYYIWYDYNGVTIESPIEIAAQSQRCAYTPTVVGTYSNVYVQVKRDTGLASLPTKYNGEFNFNLFNDGAGTADSPYLITSETQLRNIKYFLNAYYKLDRDITLSTLTPITSATQTFAGTIDGNGKYIYGANLAGLQLDGAWGLFVKTNGAKFTSINLSNFTITAESLYADFQLGVLVGKAQNTTFEYINIVSSRIEVNAENDTAAYDMYIGSIAGNAESSSFVSCKATLVPSDADGINYGITVSVEGSNQTCVYVGGIVGGVDASTTITSCQADVSVVKDLTAYDQYEPSFIEGEFAGTTSL